MTQNNKKTRIEVMLDMETADIAETAAIFSIALVPFALDGSEVEAEPSCHAIDATSCFLEGMTFDRDTQAWWVSQSSKAKISLLSDQATGIRTAINEIHTWFKLLGETYDVHLWCRGLNFDIPKLDRCFRQLLGLKEMPYPWWNLEDARTYCRAFGVHSTDIEFEGTHHSAIDDCRHQIKLVQKAYAIRAQLFQHQENVKN